MIQYFSTSSFDNSINELLNYKRKAYSSVVEDICNSFCGKGIEDIRQNRDMILVDDPLIVIKLRIMDKHNKRSKRDGYRLIYLTYQNSDKVIFLLIYPKNGPAQKLNLSDNELLNLISIYNDEAQNSRLRQIDITNKLISIITPK